MMMSAIRFVHTNIDMPETGKEEHTLWEMT